MNFKPRPSYSGYLLLGLTLATTVGVWWMTNLLLQQRTPPALFTAATGLIVLLAVTLLLLYGTITAFSLNYQLNRNGFMVRWGFSWQRVPMNHIRAILPGQSVADMMTFRGLNLLGLHLGYARLEGHRRLILRGSAPFGDSLLLVTADNTYVISPDDPADFFSAWHNHRALGATQQWTEDARPIWPFSMPLLMDGLAWALLGVGLVLLIGLLGAISLNYPELPRALPVHFDNLGHADRIEPKIFLFTLPVVGIIVWLGNLVIGSLVYRREPFGAYLLWGSTTVVQLSLWIALVTIISP